MAHRRRIPWTTRRKLMAAMWLLLALAVLSVGGWFFYQFVIMYDFEGLTPGTEPVREFLPEGGYIRESYPPYNPNITGAPTPRPTPQPTAIPMDKYALLDKRLMMPETSYEVVLCGLTEFRISGADSNRAFAVRGWGYLTGMDASKSSVYLVVSTKYGESHRMYLLTREPGASGVLHPADTGTNLDQSDFEGCVRIEDTYIDGEYRLGVIVVSNETSNRPKGYGRLDSGYNFVVKGGQITGLEKDLL